MKSKPVNGEKPVPQGSSPASRVPQASPPATDNADVPQASSPASRVPQASPPAPTQADVPQASSPAPTQANPAGEDACGTSCATSVNGTQEESDETPALFSGWHSRGYLPHLETKGGTFFVTFRLANTLPKDILEAYRFERDDIVKRAEAMGRELTAVEEKQLAKLHSEHIDSYLDAGRGDCWLNRPEIADMVARALRHFDGERYILHAWVVMPNHVHAVLTPTAGHCLSNILHNWKSFTAHEAKKVGQASHLPFTDGRSFWQRESYDHLVRDEAEFARLCDYTIQNPVKAGLCAKWEDWPYVGVAQAE